MASFCTKLSNSLRCYRLPCTKSRAYAVPESLGVNLNSDIDKLKKHLQKTMKTEFLSPINFRSFQNLLLAYNQSKIDLICCSVSASDDFKQRINNWTTQNSSNSVHSTKTWLDTMNCSLTFKEPTGYRAALTKKDIAGVFTDKTVYTLKEVVARFNKIAGYFSESDNLESQLYTKLLQKELTGNESIENKQYKAEEIKEMIDALYGVNIESVQFIKALRNNSIEDTPYLEQLKNIEVCKYIGCPTACISLGIVIFGIGLIIRDLTRDSFIAECLSETVDNETKTYDIWDQAGAPCSGESTMTNEQDHAMRGYAAGTDATKIGLATIALSGLACCVMSMCYCWSSARRSANVTPEEESKISWSSCDLSSALREGEAISTDKSEATPNSARSDVSSIISS